ncbi:sialidase family protein [Streptomyces sp. bgisy084]|uniref:sialidase family protein n=1 Tax=unclassified Streptomyces TaxID=2593676 RepID=UPI003D764095
MAYESSVPYRAGTEGYTSFRIPAVVRARSGVLLAFAEGRVTSAADSGTIHLVLKRSADGDRTWGPLQVVARNGTGTAGNPAPVALDSGRLLLLQVHNAADATEDRIRRGQVPPADGRRVRLQHSDDDGATWRIGYTDSGSDTDSDTDRAVAPNETTAAELADGSVYLNARNEAPAARRRVDTVSTDGGEHLTRPFRPQAGLTGPAVQGSALPHGDRGALLFSGPAHPSARALMTLRTSRDGGLTMGVPPRERSRAWGRTAHTVTGLPAAYSDLVRLDRDSVGLLYETGDLSAYSTITFRRIPVEEPT